ncbi:MAG: hypothetical protein K2Y39_19625 [Candidatus Obscuribacterales bacterium]|nr:hypothetical protein [Candidatus Obscuribacterales bacterium]
MKLRRRRGATLGLVAVIVLFIAILGIGFFFLSKIMGGGREVANATDAGAMNVAKRALMEPTVNAPANDEFDGLGVDTATGIPNNSGQINLLAYNRAVGRALLVALNARAIGPASSKLAGDVIDKLEILGKNLQTQLNGGGMLPGYFDTMAKAQNVKMMGPTSDVKLSMNIQPAWMITQDGDGMQKTNVYINKQVVDMMGNPTVSNLYTATTVNSAQIKSKGSWPQGAFSSSSGHNFIRAYDKNMTLSNYLDKAILGAAVGPQDRAHLVHLGQFETCATAVGYAPPNSWKTQSQSQNTNKGQGNYGGAVACAVVGSLNAEYEACIPRGYVRILNYVSAANLPGAVPVSGQDVNGGTSIFNNEFWNGPGGTGPTYHANSGSGVVFADGNGDALIQAWVDYNNSLNEFPVGDPRRNRDGKTIAKDPTPGKVASDPAHQGDSCQPIRSGNLSTGSSPNRWATVAEMNTVRSFNPTNDKCDQNNFAHESEGMSAADKFCRSNSDGGDGFLEVAKSNFNRQPLPPNGSPASEGYNGIEYLKARVVEAFGNGSRCARNVTVGGDKKAGMKVYQRNREGGGPYNTPKVDVQFANVGSPYELLMHTMKGGQFNGSCNDVIGMIHQRCKEILPTVDRAEVEALMKSQDLPPGATMFIFLPPNGTKLTMQATVPSTHAASQDPFNLKAEGTHPTCSSLPDDQLRNYSINSKDNVGGNAKGDTGIHDQPYTKFYPTDGDFSSTDIVEWKPSCGAHNFLGELSFRNETTGGGEFCKPN